jgi:hypothetical protein
MELQDILLLFLIFSILAYFFFSLRQKRLPPNTIVAFTGGLGSGKTLLAVRHAIQSYRKNIRSYYFERLIPILNLLPKKFKEKPQFYSNIPVRVGWFWYGKTMARMLTYEHLTLQTRIEEYSTILIDELGQFANQYEYDNPFVQQYIQEFVRFFRHYVDGRMFITDQSSSNIVVSIRRRINQIYNLSNFTRILFFYKVNVAEIHITEDLLNIQDSLTPDNEQPYFFGVLLPSLLRKLLRIKPRYDSRCYSINYHSEYSKTNPYWIQFKTDYFIELPNNTDMRKLFKQQGFITPKQMMLILNDWKQSKQTLNGLNEDDTSHS